MSSPPAQTPPSPTPSPAKSRWARVGTLARRASSVLAPVVPRPATPSGDKDDTTSLKGSLRRGSFSGLNTSSASLAPPSTSHEVSAPSPIAESPARELAATEEAPPVGPSPLSQAQTAEPSAQPPAAEPTVSPASPQGYVPPPLIDSTAVGPGGFTDEPDELPQSEPIQDPYQVPSRAPEPPVAQEEQPAESQPQPAAPEPQPVVPEPQPTAPEPQPVVPEPQPAAPEPQPTAPEPQPTAPEPTKPAEPEPVAVPKQTPQAEEAHIPTEPNTSKPPSPAPTTPPPMAEEPASYFEVPIREDPSKATDKAKDDQTVDQQDRSVIPKDNASPQSRDIAFPATPPRSHTDLSSTIVAPEPKGITPQPFDLDSGEHVWRGYDAEPPVSRSIPNDGPSDQSKTPSIHGSYSDPFSDPVAPRIAVTQPSYSQPMPNPYDDPHNVPYGEAPYNMASSPHNVPYGEPPYNITSSPQYSPIAPGMPVPVQEHAGARSISNHSPIDMPNTDTDERQPLLGKGPQKNPYLFPVNTATGSVVQVSPQGDAAWASTVHSPRLHSLGWIEYHLPDGTLYYVHPTRRVVTDINLREHKWIDTVTDHIDHYRDGSHTAAGTELWIQTSEITKRGFLPPRFWVDHKARTVTIDTTVENGYVQKKKAQPDDQLDAEYRYWAFMESHPSHATLPTNARAEAMDALTWSWTDRLLPSNRTIPAPFSQDECQELMALLRSFNAEQGETGLQTVVHTRIVSRILMRVAHWRQHYFRPNKALPSDVGAPAPVKYRRPFFRTLFDIIVGCLCLGIPYLLFDRHRQSRLDAESGYRNATPMAVIGACTCLVAAIVLSATITFLSLPGLDGLSRIAGFVAILFSSFSLVSTAVAVFRYKADMEHPVSHLGVEGLMLISRRSFVMSLPLVFLAYAIIAVITAIVLHSFRGISTNNMLPQEPLQDSTKWSVLGALGGLAGMLTTSVLLGGH